MNDARKYTLKDLMDAKRLGFQEGIEQAQGVVLDLDRKVLDDMELYLSLDKKDSAEKYRELHTWIWMVYQDLIVLGDKVR